MDNKKEDHITFETYKDQIEIWYKAHNIIREKAELYYDFLFSLLNIIDETYLGPDVIKSNEDMMNHFTWCFNKVIFNFEQERIYFINKSIYFDYLWTFFYKGYYMCSIENKNEVLHGYFNVLFNFNKVKTPIELESFTDLYKIFDQNLKKIN
jgi:hypothetical protein